MLAYSFLVLSLLLAIPGALVWALRPDLRRVIAHMALASLPFAATETLFYPDYWAPKFLWDLVLVIGFGVEDVLFVVGLAAFTSTAYAVVSGETLAPLPGERRGEGALRRALALLLVCFVFVAALFALEVPMIYGAPVIMAGMGAAMLAMRPDLIAPALIGALVTTVVYTAICVILAALIPEVFALDWNTDQFLDLYVLGVPVEELLYASTSGFIATIFYPFVTRARFVDRDNGSQ